MVQINKNEFLHILKISLSDFNMQKKNEILSDYEEHFKRGVGNGESEDEILTQLGNPGSIADQYRTPEQLQDRLALKEIITLKKTGSKDKVVLKDEKENRPVIISIIAACALLLFNLLLILLPFIIVAALIIGLFALTIGIIIAGLAMTFWIITVPLFKQYFSMPSGLFGFEVTLAGIGAVAFGILSLLGMYYVGRFFCKGIAKYINWNIKIIKG